MSDFETSNFFTDESIHIDPYPYFDHLRELSPIWREPHYGVYMVTGYDEAITIYNDATTFSSCNTVAGPFTKFPAPFEGDDVSEIIDQYRDTLPFSDQLPSFDPPKHTAHRGLLMRLLTPGRLRENEEVMWTVSDRQIDEFLATGRCEFIEEYAAPFTLLVIADLEGVPESDHDLFKARLAKLPGSKIEMAHKPLEFLYDQFAAYVEDRRRSPRDDILTAMAQATYPDGSTPEVTDVALIAANLFAGGQETTVRLLSFALRVIGERPDLEKVLREDRSRIPNFLVRRHCGSRARSGASSGWRAAGPRSPASTSLRGAASCCSPERPIATRACSRTRTSSTSTATTPATTPPSGTASTTAPERTSPGPRAG